MNSALRRSVPGLLPGVLQQACGALKSSWCRLLCASAQMSPGSTASPISDQSTKVGLFPPMPGEQSSLRWSGRKYEEVPIVHIKATYNNTHIQVTQPDNKYITRTSCGTEGFRNAKKSSSVAAQTAGIAAATKAVDKGVVHVRVVVKGMGPGRVHAIKGLTMGGLEVISITDNTPIPHNGCRPRKARRL
ncbi:28S ribosomal protein S11, mitochondrial [Bufo gargarizans]|uniref:28S ribosomal protein S11, mitochondrial n=1 Tax=Bufo gargarizans TaxID=30331 RepID=UPI001CF0F282|nr:28S ribosomal protein S11, mitochondrial [Bufo gargarizans]